MLVTVALIGVLVAVAIPAYQEYVQRVNVAVAYEAGVAVRNQADTYIMEKEEWPTSMTDLGYSSEVTADPSGKYEIGIYEGGLVGVNLGTDTYGDGRYVVFEPAVDNGELSWICYGQNLKEKLLPAACR